MPPDGNDSRVKRGVKCSFFEVMSWNEGALVHEPRYTHLIKAEIRRSEGFLEICISQKHGVVRGCDDEPTIWFTKNKIFERNFSLEWYNFIKQIKSNEFLFALRLIFWEIPRWIGLKLLRGHKTEVAGLRVGTVEMNAVFVYLQTVSLPLCMEVPAAKFPAGFSSLVF